MKRFFLFPLLALMVVYLTSCAGSNSNSPQANVQTSGTAVTLQTGDAANDQIAKFEVTISSIVLTGANGTSNTGNLLSAPAEVEFSHEAGAFEPLSLAHVPPGTYTGATVTISNPEVVAIVGGVPTKLTATLSSATVNVTFTPNITVGSSPMFLNFDLNLASSVTISGTTATIAPSFKVSTSTVAPENNEDDQDGEFDDAHGRVTAINAPNFTIQTSSTSITFATDSNTRFEGGLTQLSDLKVGDLVEVDSVTESNGTTVLATKVEREADHDGEEVEGLISALDHPLSKLTIVHQVDSMNSSTPPVTVDVGVTSSTVFSIRFDRFDFPSAPFFDATHIGKGQRIEVDASSSSTPLVAARVKLREQALMGTVAMSPAPTSSGFTLDVSSTSAFATLSGATTVKVIFVPGADMQTTPTAGATIRVRGLVFFDGTNYTMVAVRGDDNE
jgi:hypothetical protein